MCQSTHDTVAVILVLSLLTLPTICFSQQPESDVDLFRFDPFASEVASDYPPDPRLNPSRWLANRSVPKQELDSHRPLTIPDLDALLVFSSLSIGIGDRNFSNDSPAALGTLAHIYGLPALLAVLRDEDAGDLRIKCVRALASIDDPRIVDYLIDQLTQYREGTNNRAILVQLERSLFYLNRRPYTPKKGWMDSIESRLVYQKEWREWWDAHRNQFVHPRQMDSSTRSKGNRSPARESSGTNAAIAPTGERGERKGVSHPNPFAWIERRQHVSRRLGSDRPLPLSDLDALLRFGDLVIDKSAETSHRQQAVRCLATLGHDYTMPALLAVLRDEGDVVPVRKAAVKALAVTPNKRIVEYLIGELQPVADSNTETRAVVELIDRALRVLTNHQIEDPGFVAPGNIVAELEVRKERQRLWRQWWNRNRSHTKLVPRSRVWESLFST